MWIITLQMNQLEEAVMGESLRMCKYRSLAHVAPTSVPVERPFSTAKLIMTPHCAQTRHESGYSYLFAAMGRIYGMHPHQMRF